MTIEQRIKELENRLKEMDRKFKSLDGYFTSYPDIFELKNKYEQMVKIACEVVGIKPEQIKLRQRTQNLVLARQLICYIAVNHMGFPVTTVGQMIGRDHSTVIHSRNTFRDMLELNYPQETEAYKHTMHRLLYGEKMQQVSSN